MIMTLMYFRQLWLPSNVNQTTALIKQLSDLNTAHAAAAGNCLVNDTTINQVWCCVTCYIVVV